jgi:hypothetical protein
MRKIFFVLITLLFFSIVFATPIEDHLNDWKTILINTGYYGAGESVGVYTYVFDQTFDSVDQIEAEQFTADVFAEKFKDDTLVDEGTQLAVAAGTIYKGNQLLNPAARFLTRLSTLAIPAGEFTTVKQAIEVAESGGRMAPYMTNALSKHNMVYDNATGILRFTDTVDDISIIPKQVKLAKGNTLSKTITALRKATGLDKFKSGMSSYKKLLEIREGMRTLDSLDDVARAAKAKELASALSKLRQGGAVSDDVLRAAGFVNAQGNVGQTMNHLALRAGNATNNATKINSVISQTKPSVVSRIGSRIGTRSSAFFRGAGKVLKVGGVFIGLPKAIVNSGAELALGLTLPDVAAPWLNVEEYNDEGSADIIGAQFIVDPQFNLNVQRWKASRESFDAAIDESTVGNFVWEATSFFDPTELGWLVAEKLPALKSSEADFIVTDNGCTVGIITNATKEEVDAYITAQSDFKCLITDVEEQARTRLFLPKGKYVVMVNSKMTEKVVDKVIDSGATIVGLPDSIRENYYKSNDTASAKGYLLSSGFPSVPKRITIENPILLSAVQGDSLVMTINFKSENTLSGYFKDNSLNSEITINEIYEKIRLFEVNESTEQDKGINQAIISGNNLTLIVEKGAVQVGKEYKLLFDIDMKEGKDKLALRLTNIRKGDTN